MTEYSLVIAGLSTELFNRLRLVSEEKFAPGGKVFLSPNPWQGAYSPKYIDKLLDSLFEDYSARRTENPIPTLLLYVDYRENSTRQLVEKFFPFGLPLRIDVPDLTNSPNKKTKNELLNGFEKAVVEGSRKLREVSRVIAHHTDKANLNPLLLPLRNFHGRELEALLRTVFENAPYDADVGKLIDRCLKDFNSKHPWVTPDTEAQRAMSDGTLYFKSPGKNRHGFLRNSDAGSHSRECLLNARSRLGARYSFNLHYDCTPVKGKLKPSYDNCHGHASPPKERHVNIAPNDYII